MALPATGEAKFTLPPGSKALLLQRRGFAPVEKTLTLASGETAHFAPAWSSISAGAAGNKGESAAKTDSSVTGTNFPLGGAAPSVDFSPQGFAGWLQNVEVAQRQAADSKKELLIVFGSSDGDSDTQRLAKDLAAPQTKAAVSASFVPVIIDFPETAKGQRRLEDAHRNHILARQYGIRSVPTVALADEKGEPYFIEREWKSSTTIAQSLDSWKQKRAERDKLLSAARTGNDAARLAAAEKALVWIKEQRLISAYENDVRAWYAIAKRLDASNAAGQLEAFVEADVQLRLRELRINDDEETIVQAIAPLKEWMGKKRFVDPDRGAMLHMLAATMLLSQDQDEEGMKHMEEAATYEPKDAALKERLAAAKAMIRNRDIRSSGTGFVISEAGYLLTNHHVVEGEGKVVVRLKGVDQPLPATVIAEDANRDMALIKFEPPAGTKLTPIGISATKTGRGAAVLAFGYPLLDRTGEGIKLTEGVISALPDKERNDMYLLDMRVNPGNSGGPLCDSKGNVVGMVTAKTGRDFEGLEDTYGMAIPAPDLLKFVEQHLPKDAPAVPAAGTTKLSTEEVDERVSPAVLLILKTK
jgi:S1-C subfamily serine protease